MGSKKLPLIAPRIYDLHTSYNEYLKEIKKDACPDNWHRFLKKCGLVHTSLSRLEIVHEKKWMLAKIKYAI